MEAFQWQERDDKTPIWVHLVAGSFAGLSQHLSMLPLDNIKTHYQAGSHLRLSQIVANIYTHGGLRNFYSGSSVLALGCIPAHAIYFSIYEQARQSIGTSNSQNYYKYIFVGVTSSLFHDLVMTPTEVIKQRLQLIKSQVVNVHTMELVREMYRNQGFIAFYRSFGINYLMNVPFNSMIVFINETLKHWFGVKQGDHHLNYYLCGGLAGALASIPTCPFDVIKTKLNTQVCLNSFCEKKEVYTMSRQNKLEASKGKGESALKMALRAEKPPIIKYHTIFDTTRIIFQEEGVAGFFAGLKMRMGIQAASSAIAWGTYQMMKQVLMPVSHKF